MRILIDMRSLAAGEVSGIQEYACNLIQSLTAIDHDNEYLFFYNGLRKRPFNAKRLTIVGDDCRFKVFDWNIPNKIFDFSTRFFDWPAIDSLIKADVVFSPHFNILKTKAPRMLTFHDLSFLRHPYFFSYRQKFWHWLQGYRRQAREAAKIIVVSEHTKEDLISLLGVPKEKIEVIYSGISPEFQKIPEDSRELKEFKDDRRLGRPFWLYLGTIEPRKNITSIIRAFNILKSQSQFKDFQLILAGRPGWLYGQIQKEAKASSFSRDIVFWGKVEPAERKFLYNLAAAFVYPSFFEGFGFPPLEAQACGCPVIIADRTSLPEISGQAAVSVDPWRVGDLADTIKTVTSNISLRDKLIKAGLENIKKFSWEIAAKKTLECLTNV